MTNAQKRSLPRPTPSLLPLTGYGERCRKSFRPKVAVHGLKEGEGRGGAGRGGACCKQCRLLFPKVFLFNSARLPQRQPAEASASAREGRKHSSWVGSFAIASDISFVLLSFIIILPLSLPTRFVFFFVFFFFSFFLFALLLFFYFLVAVGPS